jgi:hypothetical protein
MVLEMMKWLNRDRMAQARKAFAVWLTATAASGSINRAGRIACAES